MTPRENMLAAYEESLGPALVADIVNEIRLAAHKTKEDLLDTLLFLELEMSRRELMWVPKAQVSK